MFENNFRTWIDDFCRYSAALCCIVLINIFDFDCLIGFLEYSDGIFLKKMIIDCSLNILFVFVVIGSGDRVGDFMVHEALRVFCNCKGFCN